MLKDKDSYPQLRPPTAALILENGDTFWGSGLGSLKAEVAELCFNTSQTGYQETLTDPSYAKQIITFTFPHIGIVGTNDEDLESAKIYAEGCVIKQSQCSAASTLNFGPTAPNQISGTRTSPKDSGINSSCKRDKL